MESQKAVDPATSEGSVATLVTGQRWDGAALVTGAALVDGAALLLVRRRGDAALLLVRGSSRGPSEQFMVHVTAT